MMNEDIHAELSLLLHSLTLGMLIMILYDFFRIFRKLIKHSVWATAFEDLLYWLVSGVCIFIMLYKENDGNLRWFVVVGIFAGMLIYNGTISRVITDRVAKGIQLLFKWLGKILSVLVKPVKCVLHKVKKAANFLEKRGEKICVFQKKQLKKVVKRVRIVISKH